MSAEEKIRKTEKEDLAVDSDFIIASQKSGDKIAQLLRVGAVYFRRDYYNDVDSDIAGYSQAIASYSLSEEEAFAVLLEWGWSVRESLGRIPLPRLIRTPQCLQKENKNE